MKKILSFVCITILSMGFADAAVRDGNNIARQKNALPQQRIATTKSSGERNTTVRSAVQSVSSRGGASASNNTSKSTVSRAATTTAGAKKSGVSERTGATTISRNAAPISRTATATRGKTTSRAAIDQTSSVMTETRTGAQYEQCKNAYFTCMDQFCKLKNDDYRRCSCSNRVYELAEVRNVMQQAGDKLTVFTENLDAVGMSAAQATAMRTASEGENALTSDTSASKALLQAIMNSIRGEDTTVGGKYSDLNSINLSFDTTNAFGTMDAGQAVATYNGQNLYSAVYPQCRAAVRADCNDASLQRAITAYLMAIEQDCNTVQTAIEEKQKQMKSAVREGSAMLDLARVENRQKHNSDDIATCLNNVEQAVLSEEVCGAGYHKCLDNGEFIDVSTGKPIAGVEKFYELETLLTFASGVESSDQKLSKVSANRTFVQNFEKRVKKFAQPALDKCTEQADVVWAEYLDKALLDIYYAQKSKVSEIKQGCFDFVSACYMNGDTALTAAMAELTGDSGVSLQPDKVALSTEMCRDYINSCNYMFDENIVADYIDNRKDTDTLTACRAVAKQCFDKFGGTGYENFYYPYSGLFKIGNALSWFTLYEMEVDASGQIVKKSEEPISECAKQLKSIDSCSSEEMLRKAFGGFDVIVADKGTYDKETVYFYSADGQYDGKSDGFYKKYGILEEQDKKITSLTDGSESFRHALQHHSPRPTGVATETYNQIVDILSTQCMNLQGRFVELQFIKDGLYGPTKDAPTQNLCISNFKGSLAYSGNGSTPNLIEMYGIGNGENMCPRDYSLNVDTASWGACLCWENGGRRSKWGTSAKCVAALPITKGDGTTPINDKLCDGTMSYLRKGESSQADFDKEYWCTQTNLSNNNQVCPWGSLNKDGYCTDIKHPDSVLNNLPEGLSY